MRGVLRALYRRDKILGSGSSAQAHEKLEPSYSGNLPGEQYGAPMLPRNEIVNGMQDVPGRPMICTPSRKGPELITIYRTSVQPFWLGVVTYVAVISKKETESRDCAWVVSSRWGLSLSLVQSQDITTYPASIATQIGGAHRQRAQEHKVYFANKPRVFKTEQGNDKLQLRLCCEASLRRSLFVL